MDMIDERFLVYTALLVVCGTAGTFLGAAAGIWTFVQVAAVVELTYWLARPAGDESARDF